MSFDPKIGAQRRDTRTENFVPDASLMGERTKLPDLDYTKLAIERLGRIKNAVQAPAGRYAALLQYLQARGSNVDAAELDRRLRTFFDNVINRVISEPKEWDQDRVLDGKSLMDFLSGVQAPAAPQPQVQAPPQDFQERPR